MINHARDDGNARRRRSKTPYNSRTNRIWIRYTPEAGKLQVGRIVHGDKGPLQIPGLTIDAADISRNPEILELLRLFLDNCGRKRPHPA